MATILAGRVAALALVACMICPALADTASRPRIGLVLGGGGARGTAHIGVIEELEKLRVPVDCVAGTSMGSLVAGAYAGGVSPQQMMDRLAMVNWRDLFEDNPSHAETNYRERRLSQSYYPNLEFGLTDEGLERAHGIVGGQKIKLFLTTLVGAERGERDIESLPLPLSIITTDIGTGEKVVFRSGDLATAMRASMSVPALLSPVIYRGRTLVDGGLVDNLPIDEVKQRCNADVVIAVDVGTPLARPEAVNSITAITGQMIGLLTEQNSNASRALLKPSDVYIKPDLEGISSSDFNKFREGAERGRQAAQAQAEKLSRYSIPEAQYLAWASKLNSDGQPLPRIDAIQIADLHHVNPEMVQKYIHASPGEPLNPVQMERDIGRIYGEGDYQSVDYSVLTTRERNILRITPTEKNWGPNYVRFGISLEAASKETDFSLRGAYHKKWLNELGGEWLSGFQLGERAGLFTEFYQPIDERQLFFLEPALGVRTDKLNIYQDKNRIAEYKVRENRAAMNVGANIGVLGQIRFGYLYRHPNFSVETGSSSLPTGDENLKGWNTSLDIDQFNRAFFPTKGWKANINYFRENELGYGRLYADLGTATSWDPYVFNTRFLYVGATEGQLPFMDAGKLGGFLNLSGYVPGQIIAGKIGFASIRGERIIGKMPLGLAGDLRAGLSLEIGKASDRFTETRLEGWRKASSIYLGGETPLGPLYLGFGMAEGGPSTLYLFLGQPDTNRLGN